MVKPSASTRQRVYRELRDRIVTLQLAPNSPISENELASELGVSRTPVREALLLLREEGLVQAFPKMGTFVSHVDADRVRLAQFLREAIECSALAELEGVELAPGDLEALRDNLARQRLLIRAETPDVARFFELDEAFHEGLLKLSGREGAWPTVQAAKAHLDRARRVGLAVHPMTDMVAQHGQVLGHVSNGDLRSALDVLRTHLRLIVTDLELVKQTAPELFTTTRMRPVRRLVTTLEPQ